MEKLTPDELKEAGSIEANTWTITPPGGEPMSLAEHEAERLREQARIDESVAANIADQEAGERAKAAAKARGEWEFGPTPGTPEYDEQEKKKTQASGGSTPTG